MKKCYLILMFVLLGGFIFSAHDDNIISDNIYDKVDTHFIDGQQSDIDSFYQYVSSANLLLPEIINNISTPNVRTISSIKRLSNINIYVLFLNNISLNEIITNHKKTIVPYFTFSKEYFVFLLRHLLI